jgi:fructose-specific component phosphotransferase system IIB-like protein
VGGAPNGWYIDLPLGQRIVTNPEADLNVVAFIGTEVPNDPCLTSLPAFIYGRDFTTAASDLVSATGVAEASAFSAQGAVGDPTIISLYNPANPEFPTLSISFSFETNGGIGTVGLNPQGLPRGLRQSLRLLGD